MSILHWIFMIGFAILGLLMFTFEYRNNIIYRKWVWLWNADKSKHLKKGEKRGFFVGNSIWMRLLNSVIVATLLTLLIHSSFTFLGEKYGFQLMEMIATSSLGMFIGSGLLGTAIWFREIHRRGILVTLKEWLSFSGKKINETLETVKTVSSEMEATEDVDHVVVEDSVKESDDTDSSEEETAMSSTESVESDETTVEQQPTTEREDVLELKQLDPQSSMPLEEPPKEKSMGDLLDDIDKNLNR